MPLNPAPAHKDPVDVLEELAAIAGQRVNKQILLAPPRDSALTWNCAAVHPMQVMETEYQGIVHRAVRGMPDPEKRKAIESKALGRFFNFGSSTPRLLGVGKGEAYFGDPHPLIDDKLRALRSKLRQANDLLDPPGDEPVDVAALKRVLTSAYAIANRLYGIFADIAGSQTWHVPSINDAHAALKLAEADLNAPRTQYRDANRQLGVAARKLKIAAKGLGSVQMFYVIETFYLFRLLIRFQLQSTGHLSDSDIAQASGELTGLMTNKHPWLNDWLRDKIVDLAERIDKADPSGDTMFFLKGGRALLYLEGNPEDGKNDWDTQIVINPQLPPEKWYNLFLRISNAVLIALQEYNAELYMLLFQNADRFSQELQAAAQEQAQPPAPPQPAQIEEVPFDQIDDDGSDDDEEDDAPPARANCKAELIDVGMPRYDTVEALEQWRRLHGKIMRDSDGILYPGPLYYISEYLMMIREVFAGDAHSLRKAPTRIERLYNMLGLNGVDLIVAADFGERVKLHLPQSYEAAMQVSDEPSRLILMVMLADFIDAYHLDIDAGFAGRNGPVTGLAQAFDEAMAQVIPNLPQPTNYPTGVDAKIQELSTKPGPLALAHTIAFGQEVSQWVEASLAARADALRAENNLIDDFLESFLTGTMFSAKEELEVQAAIRGSYAAFLQGSYAQYERLDSLDPATFISVGIYASTIGADEGVLWELLTSAVQSCLEQAEFVGKFAIIRDQSAGTIRIFWKAPSFTLTFTPEGVAAITQPYAGLAIEFAIQPPPARPLLSYVWGLPVLGLRDLIAEYREETAEIEEYGRRALLRKTSGALVEIATKAADPTGKNLTIQALRHGQGHHLMISSNSLAVGRSGQYPQGFSA